MRGRAEPGTNSCGVHLGKASGDMKVFLETLSAPHWPGKFRDSGTTANALQLF